MGHLTAELKVRLTAELKAALERRAAATERTPAGLARRYIADGLARDLLLAKKARRGT